MVKYTTTAFCTVKGSTKSSINEHTVLQSGVAVPHHFGKLDPDPYPRQSGKLDPDPHPHQGKKQDPDPHQSEQVKALEGHF
jgi:hypothetical protein